MTFDLDLLGWLKQVVVYDDGLTSLLAIDIHEYSRRCQRLTSPHKFMHLNILHSEYD